MTSTRPTSLELAQPTLTYHPLVGRFLLIELAQTDDAARERVLSTYRSVVADAAEKTGGPGSIIGFRPDLWARWTGNPPSGGLDGPSVLDGEDVFARSGGDVWVYLKGDDESKVEALAQSLLEGLGDLVHTVSSTPARRRRDGRILGRRFHDGITSLQDPATLSEMLLRELDVADRGGCWVFAQRFIFDWDAFLSRDVDAQIDIIGRNHQAVIVPDGDQRSHIRRARVFDEDGNNPKMLRQSMSFGHAGPGREKGLYFVALAANAQLPEQVLRSMCGEGDHPGTDRLLDIVQGTEGGYFYVPSAHALGLGSSLDVDQLELPEHWQVRSGNGWMFYNSADYLHAMGTGEYGEDAPSGRIQALLTRMFSRWRDNWYRRHDTPKVPHLREFLSEAELEDYDQWSVYRRKGMAIKTSLTQVHTHTLDADGSYARAAGLFRVDPNDILLGVMPELSLGRGKEVMPYLRDDERTRGMLVNLNEASAMGHVVPDHPRMLALGVGGLIDNIKARRTQASDERRREFYGACILALEGVQGYCRNWAALARERATRITGDDVTQRVWLLDNAERMERLAVEAPKTFHDAVQCVLNLHACLQLIGQAVAVGRLDVWLQPFLQRDLAQGEIDEQEAQEIIDAFWIKLAERAQQNRHHVTDHDELGATAVAFSSGNFPQGGAINQWVQQITLGGSLPDDEATPTPAFNQVTMLCLRAARRLPFNAPCVSLRVTQDMDREIVEEAARSILSGGAHPILFHEDRMVRALHERAGLPLAAARDYACDGCYEPMIAGQTEFTFGTVAPLDALEMALNQGATYSQAGSVHLRGWKMGARSKPADEIASFEELQHILVDHLRTQVFKLYHGILSNYGAVVEFCPSPLLSSVIGGCLESGRDLYDGGARYHLFAPLFVGLSVVIDSLYAIKKLVFDDDTAETTLPELLDALRCDWGYDLKEPFHSTLNSPERRELVAKKYKQLRQKALELPKFGTGHTEVDELGEWLVEQLCTISTDLIDSPPAPLADVLDHIRQAYAPKHGEFALHICPGVGTFEGYVGAGATSGASADGRRAGQPYASDMSPSPVPADLAPIAEPATAAQPMPDTYRDVYRALSSWNCDAINHGLANAAPVDLNIPESFPFEEVAALIEAYARGEVGSNLLTISCVDPSTYERASQEPERYELVRARMGGWSEYVAVMFPPHQEQHRRRPYFVPPQES